MNTDANVREAYLEHILEKLDLNNFKKKFQINDDFDEDSYTDFLEAVMVDFTTLSFTEFADSLDEVGGSTSLDEEEFDKVLNVVSFEIDDFYDFADEFEDE